MLFPRRRESRLINLDPRVKPEDDRGKFESKKRRAAEIKHLSLA